jgi:aspartyl/asparaginyl beta-hydroxylase (cupin superfamily)
MTPDLTTQADRAAAAGDLAAARVLLEQLATESPAVENWLKLGSICRALGDSKGALQAVHKALAISPLDFLGLLSRAMLLEHMASPDADEAYGRALAQIPAAGVPPPMARMVAHAESRHSAHIANRTAQMSAALEPAMALACAEEKGRIDRFLTNALRTTRPFHSEPTHFHFPGLAEQEFFARSAFPWLAQLECATDIIASECASVMSAERAELVPYIQYADHAPLDQWRDLNHSPDWTAIHLLQNGARVEANARHCPQTMALLSEFPQPRIPGCSPNAMFSLLAPHTVIPPHNGVTNTRLVCHLPLVVPDGCWFRVGAEMRPWERGAAWVFDDTIEHEAGNPSDELRIVFIIDVWHPGLSATERDAVTRLLVAEAGGTSLAL